MAPRPDPAAGNPADPAASPAAGDPEGQRVASLDERFGKLEAEQAEQKGMLQKIIDKLPGGGDQKPANPAAEPPAGTSAAAAPADIQSQVRREIAEAKEREAAEARAKGDADWRKSVDEALEAVKAEKRPRDPQAGIRGRLQRAMFGNDGG